MDRKYSIYKLTSPSGGVYVGLTMQTVKVRWQCHVKKAKKVYNHPLYNAIRKHGACSFIVETLVSKLTEKEAQEAEKKHIAEIPLEHRYNISDGGETDGTIGGKLFWEFMENNPEEKVLYLAKFSKIKSDDDWSDYEAMSIAALDWRKSNPRESYKASARALRIANRNRPEKIADTRTLKERLLWKHRRDLATQRSVTKVWAERSKEDKELIFSKISESHKSNWLKVAKEDRPAMTEKARSSIDRKKQGAAASKGIKQFWIDLKNDPERYTAYIEQRKITLFETLKRKKNENV